MKNYIKSRNNFIKESNEFQYPSTDLSWNNEEGDAKVIEDMFKKLNISYTIEKEEIEESDSHQLSKNSEPVLFTFKVNNNEGTLTFVYKEADIDLVDEGDKEEFQKLLDEGFVYDTSEYSIVFNTSVDNLPNGSDVSNTKHILRYLNLMKQ